MTIVVDNCIEFLYKSFGYCKRFSLTFVQNINNLNHLWMWLLLKNLHAQCRNICHSSHLVTVLENYNGYGNVSPKINPYMTYLSLPCKLNGNTCTQKMKTIKEIASTMHGSKNAT